MSETNSNGQRRFAVMGKNTYKIIEKLTNNQRVCRLLKYQTRNPFDPNLPDVDGVELLNKQLCIVPKIYDGSTEKMSYIVAVFDNFVINSLNRDYKISTVRFDIACPYDEWALDDQSLRPYLLMQEIDNMFNQKSMAGIGNLAFYRADALTLSPQIGGYSMEYKIYEFN